jgi:hypothetical protein
MGTKFVGPIKLVGWFTCNKYIIVATNHATKWVEAKTLKTKIVVVIKKIMYEYI